MQSVVQRKGGCGTYGLFQCGSAGHNIRSKPAMQGTPIGRLVKGNKIEAIEEVSLASFFLWSVKLFHLFLVVGGGEAVRLDGLGTMSE